jgi:mannose-6-phosphate isomerase-like protein (cupin superfamily)
MAGEHLNAQARRVVSGLDENGKSTIVFDGNTTTRVATPGFTAMDIWQIDGLPGHVNDDDSTTGEVALSVPLGGQIYRLCTFAPDSEWDPAASYKESLEAMGGGDAHAEDDSGIAGIHQTDTVDVVTVVSGEVYAVLETTETLLRPGDSFVQRGTKHTWSNRSDKPCTIVALMMTAKR